MDQWQVIDTPEMLQIELQIEMRARKRAQRNHTREQENEPDPVTVFSWRRFYLRLERHSQATEWLTTLNKSRQQGMQPELCKHNDQTLLKNTGNKYAMQTFCQKCQKIIAYNHTKEGVITWMKTFQNLVVKNKIPPAKNGNGTTLHPDDPDASRYCRRCTHPMEPVQNLSGCRTWSQCSQHSAKDPCNFAKNGHLPPTPGNGSQSKAKQEKSKDVKRRLWIDHNTVIDSENQKISGATVNNIGKKHNGRKYIDILKTSPKYVDWVIATAAAAESESSVELLHMARFFLAARIQQEAQAEQDSSSPPASSTTQPTGKSSFVKPKGKSKSKASQPPQFHMAGDTTDEEM
jgi:hypothetical protein